MSETGETYFMVPNYTYEMVMEHHSNGVKQPEKKELDKSGQKTVTVKNTQTQKGFVSWITERVFSAQSPI